MHITEQSGHVVARATGRVVARATGNVVARLRQDDGLTTAEYAVGTIAAAGLGGLLLKLLTSTPVRDLLWGLISSAFSSVLG